MLLDRRVPGPEVTFEVVYEAEYEAITRLAYLLVRSHEVARSWRRTRSCASTSTSTRW